MSFTRSTYLDKKENSQAYTVNPLYVYTVTPRISIKLSGHVQPKILINAPRGKLERYR